MTGLTLRDPGLGVQIIASKLLLVFQNLLIFDFILQLFVPPHQGVVLSYLRTCQVKGEDNHVDLHVHNWFSDRSEGITCTDNHARSATRCVYNGYTIA